MCIKYDEKLKCWCVIDTYFCYRVVAVYNNEKQAKEHAVLFSRANRIY